MKENKTIDVQSSSTPTTEPARQPLPVATRDPRTGAVTPAGQQAPPAPAPAAPLVTAAQAKIEAVANLTMAAYERAATLQLTPQESEALQAPFPDEAFKPGAGGKEHLIYIEHAFLRERLNQVLGIGQWALVPRSRWAEDFVSAKSGPASRIYVEAMLIVRGSFVSEAVGEMEYYKNNSAINYGDAVEGAKTAALRRCCKEFGVGLQAWQKDWCEGWWERKRANEAAKRQRAKTPPAQTQAAAAAPAKPNGNGNSAAPSQPPPQQQQPPQQPPQQPTKTPPKQPEAETKVTPGPNGQASTYQPVTVQDVVEKKGNREDGAPWHAYLCKFSDGYNTLDAGTFDSKIGELAKELADREGTCRITVRPGRKPGTQEIVELVEIEAEAEPDGNPAQDDLPM